MDIIDVLLAEYGLIARGGFNLDSGETLPGNRPARSVLLIGHGGAAMWPHFAAWRRAQDAVPENPLDTWSKQVIGKIAGQTDAIAVFPSDKPYLPFQQWAMRAEGLKPSPLGILMHPEYGLWHAWRGALLFDHEISIKQPAEVIHHCDLCDGKPCLISCPVDAFSGGGYDVPACVGHVEGNGGVRCRDGGCLARNACPVAPKHRYSAEQQAFHLAAFLRAQNNLKNSCRSPKD